MDILIKNMEMPKGNDVLIVDSAGTITKFDRWAGKAEATDPLKVKAIELPPHNDLADKSVIIERMGDAHDELWDKVDEKALSECHVAFLKAVMYAPTVLEASK